MQAKVGAGEQRTFTEEARRAQIVAAATEVVAEAGYAKATYARIAKRAGLSSTGLISYHFAGKDELLEQVLYAAALRADAAIRPRVEAEETAAGKLRARIEAELGWIAEHPHDVRAIYEISMNARTDEGSLKFGEAAVMEVNLTELQPILRLGQERGEFRDFDVPLMGMAIKAAVDVAVGRLWTGPDITAEQCAAELTALFERAVRADS